MTVQELLDQCLKVKDKTKQIGLIHKLNEDEKWVLQKAEFRVKEYDTNAELMVFRQFLCENVPVTI
jgi:hypothetical protein